MNYEESIAYLESLNVFGIKLGLDRIRELLKRMDMPQERYHTIHVTGTNGKGSVSAMLAKVLQTSGIHTGFYSSPHLVSYTERVRIDGQPLSEEEWAADLTVVKGYVDGMLHDGLECPTQFEVLTALAFYAFARHEVEYAVIEVGLGGLLDSTNVIIPDLSIITNVTFEHADKMGGTIEGIAHHKAGIIKEGVPIITGATGVPLEIIRKTAEDKGSDIFVEGEDFQSDFVSFDGKNQHLSFSSEIMGVSKVPYELHLLGRHQVDNSSLVLMAAQIIHSSDERVTQDKVREALAVVTWPARFERVDYDGQVVMIDGAHNPAGMTALRQSLDEYFPVEQRVYLLGILRDKDVDKMLDILLRPNDTVVVTLPQSERASDPMELAKKVSSHVQHVEAVANNAEALNRALELANKEKLLVMAGSLYLVGGVRQMLLDRKE